MGAATAPGARPCSTAPLVGPRLRLTAVGLPAPTFFPDLMNRAPEKMARWIMTPSAAPKTWRRSPPAGGDGCGSGLRLRARRARRSPWPAVHRLAACGRPARATRRRGQAAVGKRPAAASPRQLAAAARTAGACRAPAW